MRVNLCGSNEPMLDWEYDGCTYRLSVVGGLVRLEQEIRTGRWYLVKPSHDSAALMACAHELIERLRNVEQSLRDGPVARPSQRAGS